MANPTAQQFYAVAHEGNAFGVKGPFYGPKGHLGQDYNKWPKNTVIPSWTPGTVVYASPKNKPSSTLGYLVIVERPDGKFAGFCHMSAAPTIKVGTKVAVGTALGKLGNTGSLVDGYHCHCTLEPRITIGTEDAIDPRPYIHAMLGGFAGGGESPIAPNTGELKIVKHYISQDRKPKTLAPGAATFSTTSDGKTADNVVGAVGQYIFVAHLYGNGFVPGDTVDITLVWENAKTKNKPSPHYTETREADKNGLIRANVAFARGVASGDRVFYRVLAPATNSASGTITAMDVDALLCA